ncbi:DsrE family protein [Acidianus manzaensis]|uniref:Sulfur reduction protein DsrE n=1 Tax=Acidianus manzaensis TaxID=282676 RepID=A0A1W6JXA9_9CREN|nr:DsrE family protein [Acidianus manzaensis]ARM74885.1 sulfur reduction protein DsrE [Acidianus manzaensis]
MKRVAYLALTNLAQYILVNMILPQIEENRHNADVKGIFFIHDNVYMLTKGTDTAERLRKIADKVYLQACDQCTYMRNLANSLIEEAKIGCFPDFYEKVLDKVDLIITI